MSDSPMSDTDADDDGPSFLSLVISLGIIALFGVCWLLKGMSPGTGTSLAFLLSSVAVISIVIWQACDPFADAAQWIGDTFRLPGSVRGATLDAIASSMPELFSGIFFVVVAISAARGGSEADIVAAGAEGYGSTIATCAGSAVYNMILIPAFCALVISFTRKSRPTIDVEDEVISRDGMWFVGCELLLIVFLFQDTMRWWMGVVYLLLYAVYIGQLYRDAMVYRKKLAALKQYHETHGNRVDTNIVIDAMQAEGLRVSPALVVQSQEEGASNAADDEEEPPETAGLLFGYLDVPLNKVTVWVVIAVSTMIAAIACYWLVEVTLETAAQLNVPAFFVAVILAAAASSVPDTFLAIGASQRGDDSGAVSNAFGSNIFDICVCLSIPLFVNSYLTGWQPVSLLQDGKPIPGLVGLRVLLVALTVTTLLIMWHNRQLTRNKAFVLCGLYVLFIAYAVLGSMGFLF